MYHLPLLCCVQLCHAAQAVISSRFSCFSAFSFPSFSLRALKLFSVNHSEGESLLSFSLRAPDIYFQPLCLRSIFIRLGHLLPFFIIFFLHSRLLPLSLLKSTGGSVHKVFLDCIKWEIFNNNSQSKCRLLKILSHRCVLGMISFFDKSVTEFFVILHRKKKLIRQWVHRHIVVYL